MAERKRPGLCSPGRRLPSAEGLGTRHHADARGIPASASPQPSGGRLRCCPHSTDDTAEAWRAEVTHLTPHSYCPPNPRALVLSGGDFVPRGYVTFFTVITEGLLTSAGQEHG